MSDDPSRSGTTGTGDADADIDEGLVGSLLSGIPAFVGGATQAVTEFVAARPVSLVASNALAVGILRVADTHYSGETQCAYNTGPI